ncbi:MAG: MarR family transcriptional regulator [Ignavibacteriaceae bacterium]|jgi:DNA-binding MarR family transcriptional regulator|nr:MarR family transcriptional regulator [Ignavibacteriaceae bacterium]MCW8961694.1 MarR family transcriptional regulator [Ignavibacteriaceae bacterium]MCW9095151.1 MarR family transcriptional regulator [Ignavibacteriaceae bacterium]MCW9098014.1 MarR family transcriptional regulator [Ignavibacteriaceae bacterium]
MGDILKRRLRQKMFSSVEQEAILNLFIASNYIHSKLDSLCTSFDITLAQFNVLRILKGAHPNSYPRSEIIKRMVEPAPDVTRLIDRLVNDGLVERFISAEDRRLSMSRITKKGINLLIKINPEVDKFLSDYSSALNKNEKETLSLICEKLYTKEIEE